MFLCSGQRERSAKGDPAGGEAGLRRRAAGPESSGTETGGQNQR